MNREKLVGARGFEPPTPRSRTECSTRLSHAPTGGIYRPIRRLDPGNLTILARSGPSTHLRSRLDASFGGQAEHRLPDYPITRFFSAQRQLLHRRDDVMCCQIAVQRRPRDVAIADDLVIRPVVRLPIV